MNKIFLKSLATALLMLMGGCVMGQLSHGGRPQLMDSKGEAKSFTLPKLDNQALLQEDMEGLPGSGPMRIGVMQKASLDLSGYANQVVSVASPGATFVALYFSEYELPQGGRLFVYNDEGFCLGAFTAKNQQKDGTFWTQALPGERVFVEYDGPSEGLRLTLDRVLHGYKEAYGSSSSSKDRMGISGDCHINVICPEGDPYRDQIRSVVHLNMATDKEAYVCSGALINNTANDKTPYVLTAYHCQDLPNPLVRWTIYFNYEATYCENNWVGPNDQSLIGADIVAKETPSGGSDMCLLRLHDSVPDAYRPYYAGWDRTVVARPTDNRKVCFGIHHPAGDFKKISIPYTVQQGQGNGQFSQYPVVLTKYYKAEWHLQGIIEGGSSGSPLFNDDKLIIGQLSAGHGDCSDPSNAEAWYGRFASDWVGGGSASTRVSDWLDPIKSGVMQCPGLDYTTSVQQPHIVGADQLPIYPNPGNGMVHVNVDEIGEANYQVYDMSGFLLYEGTTIFATQSQALNLTFLPSGSYIIQLQVGEKRYANTVLISK